MKSWFTRLLLAAMLSLLLVACQEDGPEQPTVTVTSIPGTTETPGEPDVTDTPGEPAVTVTAEITVTATITPTDVPDDPGTPSGSLDCQGEDTLDEFALSEEEDVYFIDNQVILTGAPDQVMAMIEAVNGADDSEEDLIDPNPLRNCIVSRQDRDPELQQSELFPGDVSQIAFGLYHTNNPATTVRLVNALRDELQLRVFADPNYLIFPAQSLSIPSGDPWAGRPPHPGPWSNNWEARQAFCSQIAFQQIGLDQIGPDQLDPDGCPNEGGQGITVVIFDTAPKQRRLAADVFSELALTVVRNEALVPIQVPRNMTWTLEDHGLFVAGLAHAVAPNANYILYEVLDKHALGNMYSLAEALQQFAEGLENSEGEIGGVVVNLSLGITRPPSPDQYDLPADGEALVLIELALQRLNQLGAVIVAASGNDSDMDTSPLAMQHPAAYNNVIGVGAYSPDAGSQLACYSNMGSVLAPAGDGTSGIGYDHREHSCIPAHNTCTDNQCPYGIISLATLSPNGYAFWVGTSFATPLISGMAAYALSQGTTPENIEGEIQCSISGAPGPLTQPSDTNPAGSGLVSFADFLTCLP